MFVLPLHDVPATSGPYQIMYQDMASPYHIMYQHAGDPYHIMYMYTSRQYHHQTEVLITSLVNSVG